MICRHFAQRGYCNKMDCPYAHASVNKSLSNVNGVTLEDLGECAVDSEGVYHPKSDLDTNKILATVTAEMDVINHELAHVGA